MEIVTNKVILETIDRVNRALEDDPNAMVSTRNFEVNPSAAYLELLRELLTLREEHGIGK